MTNLNGALVLITGANGGFGTHMRRQFLTAGSRLILSDIEESDVDSADIVASISADLSDEKGCRTLYDQVTRLGLLPDVIVNNAGVAVGGRFDHVPTDRWEQLMQINLLAPMRICYLFLPHLIERGSGHIVNISSIAAWRGSKGLTSYCAAKYGLRGFSEALSGDLKEFGIHVSTVYPFFSRTPILDSEQFGYQKRREVPDDIVTDPADVVAEIVKGLQTEKPQIFPDKTAKKLHYLSRFAPWILQIISRRHEQKIS